MKCARFKNCNEKRNGLGNSWLIEISYVIIIKKRGK